MCFFFSVRRGTPVSKGKIDNSIMELVVAQEAQIVPRYIVYFKKKEKETKEFEDEEVFERDIFSTLVSE